MLEKIKAKKAQVEQSLLQIPGVVGVGIGFKESSGSSTDRISIRVYVKEKKSDPGSDAIPDSFTLDDGTVVQTDVVEVGEIELYSFNDRYRPANPGASVGVVGVSAVSGGTLGAVCEDLTDGTDVILSTNSALANFDQASIGAAILQPAPSFGGNDPADKIGELKRKIDLNLENFGQNQANAAIATITDQVNDTPMCGQINKRKDRVAGMLIAGSSLITVVTPIETIENLLQVDFRKTADVSIGQTLKKCGAATEYSEFQVSDIDATFTAGYNGNIIMFTNQIICPGGTTDAAAGDSGSLVYKK